MVRRKLPIDACVRCPESFTFVGRPSANISRWIKNVLYFPLSRSCHYVNPSSVSSYMHRTTSRCHMINQTQRSRLFSSLTTQCCHSTIQYPKFQLTLRRSQAIPEISSGLLGCLILGFFYRKGGKWLLRSANTSVLHAHWSQIRWGA